MTNNGDGTFDYDPNGQFEFLEPAETTTDSFTYTVTDGNGEFDTATVTVTIAGEALTDSVQIRLETTDLQDTIVSEVEVGMDFVLKVFVQDIRSDTQPDDRGVFQAYLDVTFDDAFVTATGPFSFGDAYQEQTSGSLSMSGVVDEAGGTQTNFGFGDPNDPGDPFEGPLGSGEFLLFSLPFSATDVGMFTFAGDPADDLDPAVLLFDSPISAVPAEEIVFGTTDFSVTPRAVDADDDAFMVQEDSTNNTLLVLLNDEVNSGGTLTIVDVGPLDEGGTVINNGDHLLYTPLADFVGTETFTYTADDGLGNSDQATVVVTVLDEPDAPMAMNDGGAEYTTDEDTAFTTGNVLDNDTDAEGDALSVSGFDTTGTLGEVTSNGDGSFNYDPNGQFEFLGPGESDTDSFTYMVTDGVLEDTATVTITITGVNDDPDAVDDSGVGFMTDEHTAFTTDNVLDNDTDIDGGELFVSDFDTTGTLGLVTNNGDGTFHYDPNGQFDLLRPGETDTDRFHYTVADGNGGFDTAMVTISIAGAHSVQFRLETADLQGIAVSEVETDDAFLLRVFVQDIRAPDDPNTRGVFAAYVDVTFVEAFVTATDLFTFGPSYQDQTSGFAEPGLIDEAGGANFGFDVDVPDVTGPLGSGEFLLFSVVFEATNAGTFDFESNPADLDISHDVLLFDPTDPVPDDDILFGTTTLTVNVAPVIANDDPDESADPNEWMTDEDTAFTTGNVVTNDIDADGDMLSVTGFDTTGTLGEVIDNSNGTFDYDPNGQFEFLGPGETETDSFTYTVSDGNQDHTATATVTITITGVNDPPEAIDDSGVGFMTDEDTAFITGNVLENDTDVDGGELFVSDFDVTGTLGEVTSNGDGTFNYDPNGQFAFLAPGETDTDSFQYTVADGNGGTDTGVAMITISGAIPPPVDFAGFVYVDGDNDGEKDSVERAIGGVSVRLEGMDILGSPVSEEGVTDAKGRFRFTQVVAGDYTVIEEHPMFFLDGIDTQNGVVHTDPNDRIRVVTTNTFAPEVEVLVGERGLHPNFIHIADFINTALRRGIDVAYDSAGNQLWYSPMVGWESITSVSTTFSGGGSTAHLSVGLESGGNVTYNVPTDPIEGWFRVKGETVEGRVVQFIGTMEDFEPLAAAPGATLASGLPAQGDSLLGNALARTQVLSDEAEPDQEGVDAVFAEVDNNGNREAMASVIGGIGTTDDSQSLTTGPFASNRAVRDEESVNAVFAQLGR